MLNNTSTSMGRRLFKDRLLNPIMDSNVIQSRYDRIDDMISGNYWESVEKVLVGILDIDRLHRRIAIGSMNPNGFDLLMNSYKKILISISL